MVGPPVADPVRAWRGTARPGLPTVRMLHVGDCSLRSMECSHDFRAPLGFPRATAETLLQHGVGMDFAHYFAVLFEDLPDMDLLRRRADLAGDPDVIVVHVGTSYARRLILPDTPTIMKLRCDLGRRLGHRVFSVYRPLRPVVRVIGRPAHEWHGSEALERFLREVSREWPEARVALMHPFPRVYPYPKQLPVCARTAAHLHAAAERCGAAELDYAELLGTDPSLRGANGYNLNARGSEIVGRELAHWILATKPPASLRGISGRRPVRVQPARSAISPVVHTP